MRAIVTYEQRRIRPEAGHPSIEFASLERGDLLRKGRAVLRGRRVPFGARLARPVVTGRDRGASGAEGLRLSSVTYSQYPLRGRGLFGPSQTPATGRRDPSSFLVAPQNRPAIIEGICRSQHSV